MPTKRSTVRSRSLALRLTPKLRAVLSRIVARAKRSIVADVKDGTVPRSVRTIGGLGEYVDQNVYFLDAHGDFDPEVEALAVDLGRDGVDSQPMYDFLTLAMDRVEAWMKTGALKRIPVARKSAPKRKVANPSKPLSFYELTGPDGEVFEIVRASSTRTAMKGHAGEGAIARRLRDSEIGEGDLNFYGPRGAVVTDAMRAEHRRSSR